VLDITAGQSISIKHSRAAILIFNAKGLPQFIQLGFQNPVVPMRLSITFQGGFVGTRCGLLAATEEDKKEWRVLSTVYPEDVNRRQTFDIIPAQPEVLSKGVSGLKLIFEDSSDFFGRITIYDLSLEGMRTSVEHNLKA
jgi:hypothetical protein